MRTNLSTEPPASTTGLETVVIPPEEIFHSCYESEGFIKFQYTVDDLLLAASTAATVFNFLVVFCAFKLFKRSGDTMHLFIINMTLGDLVLTVFSLPNEFLIRKHTFLRHIHLCALIHFFNWLGLAVSGLSLTLLNVDKLIYFRWPMRYDQTMSKRRAAVLCFFIWGVSFGFVSYVWIFDIVYATPDCMLQMTDVKKYYYEIFMIMFCVLPVTSSLFLSTYLFRLTRQKRHAPARNDGGQVDIRTFKNKMRSLVFIFATTVWTSFSLLPYRIFNICRIHLFDWNSIACEQRVIMNWLAWLLIYLLTLNPIVNPVITSIIYAPYRMTLKKLLINIPIGNRLQYTYRGDTTETSYLSVRRTRGRCDAATGPGHELTRLNAAAPAGSAGYPPAGTPKTSASATARSSPVGSVPGQNHTAPRPSPTCSATAVLSVSPAPVWRRRRANSDVEADDSDAVVTLAADGDLAMGHGAGAGTQDPATNFTGSADSVDSGGFVRVARRVAYIDDTSGTSADAALSPSPVVSPEHTRRSAPAAEQRVSPRPHEPPPTAADWRQDADGKRAENPRGRKQNKIFIQNCIK